ncbi:MAG: GNAT family N-acetyltransferase [Ignavibacteria bacterium]|nr:GNAT family N-acetyltransferase [Ignavibacteria bacterium]
MQNISLIEPSVSYKASFLDFVLDVKVTGYESYVHYATAEENFDEFLLRLKEAHEGVNLPENRVPCSSYWLIDERDEVVGVFRIRHRVDSDFLQLIGHIGYEIKSTHRKMGYGTKILKLGLAEAKNIGLDVVLINCDDDNWGSLRIIEKFNGKYKTSFNDPETKKIVKQFEVSTLL